MKPNTYGTKKFLTFIFSLMISTAIMVFFAGENIMEQLAPESRPISTSSESRLISTSSESRLINTSSESRLISNSSSNSTTPKTFLYLVMAEKCLPVHMRGASSIGNETTCKCDVIMFGYKEKCDEAKNGNLEHVEYIHRSDTTWNTGRNYLYEHAMKRKTVYLYYIFVDGDASMLPNADTNVNVTSVGLWRSFENFLVEYEPAVGITTYCHSSTHPCFKRRNTPGGNGVYVLSGWLFDACFNAFHHDVLPYLLPYNLKNENASWCYSQHYVATLAKHYFSGSVLIYGNVNILNGGHRNYPRTSDAERFKEQDLVISKYVEKIAKSLKKPEWKSRINVSEKMDEHICKC